MSSTGQPARPTARRRARHVLGRQPRRSSSSEASSRRRRTSFTTRSTRVRGRAIGVVRVEAPRQPFYIVGRDVGRLREGQITIRQGSVTRGITLEDLTRLYLTVGYGWADQILQKYGAAARLASAQNDRLRILQDEQRKIVQQMYGMPARNVPRSGAARLDVRDGHAS
jgi:hypothetical protein